MPSPLRELCDRYGAQDQFEGYWDAEAGQMIWKVPRAELWALREQERREAQALVDVREGVTFTGNMCDKGCGEIVAPTGKRGRPAKRHPWCAKGISREQWEAECEAREEAELARIREAEEVDRRLRAGLQDGEVDLS